MQSAAQADTRLTTRLANRGGGDRHRGKFTCLKKFPPAGGLNRAEREPPKAGGAPRHAGAAGTHPFPPPRGLGLINGTSRTGAGETPASKAPPAHRPCPDPGRAEAPASGGQAPYVARRGALHIRRAHRRDGLHSAIGPQEPVLPQPPLQQHPQRLRPARCRRPAAGPRQPQRAPVEHQLAQALLAGAGSRSPGPAHARRPAHPRASALATAPCRRRAPLTTLGHHDSATAQRAASVSHLGRIADGIRRRRRPWKTGRRGADVAVAHAAAAPSAAIAAAAAAVAGAAVNAAAAAAGTAAIVFESGPASLCGQSRSSSGSSGSHRC